MSRVAIRSIQQIVEQQYQRATMHGPLEPGGDPLRAVWPVITISRETCAGGTTIGRSVAERLGFACWDQELLTRVAERAGAIEDILASVDERVHSLATEFVRSLMVGFEYTQDEYKIVLTKVVRTIAAQGAAVLVGRGAHFILPPSRCLRVRVTCPSHERIARMMQRDGVSEGSAQRLIKQTDAKIAAFMRYHFHKDASELGNFDVIVNTGSLSIQKATDLIAVAYRIKFGDPLALPASRPLGVLRPAVTPAA